MENLKDFSKLDKYKDGKLSKDEHAAAHKEKGGSATGASTGGTEKSGSASSGGMSSGGTSSKKY